MHPGPWREVLRSAVVCPRSKAQAAGSHPSPGVLQSLQASAQRTAHVYALWRAEGKGVMASASLGLVSDRLVLCLIFRLVIR